MSTRTITECDRCHREVRGEAKDKMVSVTIHKGGGRQIEMCSNCETKFDRFMSGDELEVPP